MDTRYQQGTAEKPEDFHLVLFWVVFQTEILHIMYMLCGILKYFSGLVKAVPYYPQ